MRNCNCEHWQICPTCQPERFDSEGNLKPPEPTPLQACQAQVKALTSALFQAQEAAKALVTQRNPLSEVEIRSIIFAVDRKSGSFVDFARAIERAHGIS